MPDEPYLGFTLNPVLYEILLCNAQQKTPLVLNVDSFIRLCGHWPCKLLLNFHLWLKLM